MSIDVGITGLAKSGKTTVFNALNKSEVDIGTSAPHIGTVKVPEPRLQTLADILQPKRVVPVEVKYTDIGAPLKTIGGQLLTQLIWSLPSASR